jgi:hypothetical protein
MAAEFQYDVFLSYNQADRPRVRQLAEALKAAVYHCCENSFGDLEKFCFRDTIVNRVPQLKEWFGRDITLVARPRGGIRSAGLEPPDALS